MKILLTVLLLPCVFGAHTICSDNRVCPEGTKCCTTYDDKIRCCDVNNPDSIYVKTSKPLRVAPSTPLHAFVNATQHIARYGSCIEDITCYGTCCGDECCPWAYAECCENGCCGSYSICCEGYTKYIETKQWCCVKDLKTTTGCPSTPLQPFVNATQHIARYGSCIEGITCHGTCCGNECFPYADAACCDNGCCDSFSICCEGYTKYIVTKKWCCVKCIKCGDADDHHCLSEGSFLTPYFIVIVFTATLRMWLLTK